SILKIFIIASQCWVILLISGLSISRRTQLPTQGGLEGCKPSKKPLFLVLVAGRAGHQHQKKRRSWGGKASPNPSTAYVVSPATAWEARSVKQRRGKCEPRRPSSKCCSEGLGWL